MSSDLYPEITATATAVLAVFAITLCVTVVFALLAFHKQSREVAILAGQN